MKKRILSLLLVCVMLLSLLPTAALATGENEAQIVGGSEYATLQDAVAAATDGQTIQLLKDVTASEADSGMIWFTSKSGSFTLDCNGHTLTGGVTDGYFGSADLTIKGFKSIETTYIKEDNGQMKQFAALWNNARNMVVEDGEFTATNAVVMQYGGTVELKDGTYIMKGEDGPVVLSLGGKTTIRGGTYKGAANLEKVCAICAAEGGAVDVYGGTFQGYLEEQGNSEITIYGGTFSVDPTDYLAEGHTATQVGDVWIVDYVAPTPTYVAQIVDGAQYETLKAAVDAAADGAVIELLSDFAEGTIDASDKTFTLDLKGHTWTASQRIAMFGARTNFTLIDTVGTGVITNEGTTGNSPEPDPSGLLDFGTFSTAVYKGGKLVTKGRELAAVNGLVGSTARFEGTCVETDSGLRGGDFGFGKLTVTITAGTFNVDPTSYVAEGYKVTKSGNVWTVGKPVAQIGEDTYLTLAEAIAVVTESDTKTGTITMIEDVDYGDVCDSTATKAVYVNEIPNGYDITLDLNGKTIQASRSGSKSTCIIHVSNGGALTVDDSSAEKTGTIKLYAGVETNPWDVSSSPIISNGSVTVNAGTIISGDQSGSYAVDMNQNGFTAIAPTFTMNGGKLESTYVGLRFFANGGSEISGTINDGEISGAKKGLWVHQSKATGATKNATVTINGGTITSTLGNAVEDWWVATDDAKINIYIKDGKFAASTTEAGKKCIAMDDNKENIVVTGGLFNQNLNLDEKEVTYVAAGYACVDNTDYSTRTAYPYVVKPVQVEMPTNVTVTEDNKVKVGDEEINLTLTKGEGTEPAPTAVQAKTAIEAVLTNENVSTFADTKIEEAVDATKKASGQTGGFNLSMILDALKTEAVNNHGMAAEAVSGDTEKVKLAETTVADTDVSKTISIDLTAATVTTTQEAQTVVSLSTTTFDVKPIATITVTTAGGEIETIKAVIPNEAITSPITFRLPVEDGWDNVKVYHEKNLYGTYPVCGADGERYVELASKEFSEWTIEQAESNSFGAVCKTTTKYYDNLEEAFANVAEGDTITLLGTCTLSDSIKVDKDVTLDLNGQILTGDNVKRFEIVGNKTLTVKGTTAGSLVSGVRFNVGETAVSNGNLVLNGGEYSIQNNTVVHVDGDCTNCSVTIKDAIVSSNNDNGIQLNGKGTFVVDNSEISGATAIYQKAGTLTIKGTSKITANGGPEPVVTDHNGAHATGDAIVLDSTKGYKGDIILNIEAGEITSKNGAAVREAIADAPTTYTQQINVTGGTLTSNKNVLPIVTSDVFNTAETAVLDVAGTNVTLKKGTTPVANAIYESAPSFTSFGLKVDGIKYNVTETNWGTNNTAAIEIANSGTVENVQAVFAIDYGTVQYKVGDGTWKTIENNGLIEGLSGTDTIHFKVFNPGADTKSTEYTVNFKVTGPANTNYTFTVKNGRYDTLATGEGTKYVMYDVYLQGGTANVDEAGAFDFEITYNEYLQFVDFVANDQISTLEENNVGGQTGGGTLKVAAAHGSNEENGTKEALHTSASGGVMVGTLVFNTAGGYTTAADGHFELTFGNANATPKGYDKNNGTITTTVDLGSYLITKADDVEDVQGWLPAAGGTGSVQSVVDKQVTFGTNLIATANTTGTQEVIRTGNFQYQVVGGTATTPSVNTLNQWNNFSIFAPGTDITAATHFDVTATSKYITITFDGGDGATLSDGTTAYATQGVGDALYGSIADYIAGGENYFTIPTQAAKTGYRLETTGEGQNLTQQWTYQKGTTSVTETVTTTQLTPTCSYSKDDDFNQASITLTAKTMQQFKVTFVTGDNCTSIMDGQTDATATPKTVDKGASIADLENAVTVTPAAGYTFDEWVVTETGGGTFSGETVTKDITLTATVKAKTFNVNYSGAENATITYTAGVTNNKATYAASGDITFTLSRKTNKKINTVTYTVAPDSESGFGGSESVALTAEDGVYSIPLSKVKGDVTITVTGINQYTVTFVAEKFGKVDGPMTNVVDEGTSLWDAVSGKDVIPNPGYQFTGWYTDRACTTKITDSTVTAVTNNTVVYAGFTAMTYTITLDELVNTNNMTGIVTSTGEPTTYTVTHATDAVFQLKNDIKTAVSKVEYKIGSGEYVELTPDGGKYTIPGEKIVGNVDVRVTTLADEAFGYDGHTIDSSKKEIYLSFIARDDDMKDDGDIETDGQHAYNANVDQNLDMKILVLSCKMFRQDSFGGESKFFKLDDGTQLYWSPRYQAYLCWVNASETSANLSTRIQYVSDKTSTAIKYDGDLNFDNKVNSADAGIVNDALLGTRKSPTSALQLFNMDVVKGNGNSCTVDAKDVHWILQKAVGLIPNPAQANDLFIYNTPV